MVLFEKEKNKGWLCLKLRESVTINKLYRDINKNQVSQQSKVFAGEKIRLSVPAAVGGKFALCDIMDRL